MGIIDLFLSCMECNDCHERLTENSISDVIYLTDNKERLQEEAFDRGWKLSKNTWMCPACYKKRIGGEQ